MKRQPISLTFPNAAHATDILPEFDLLNQREVPRLDVIADGEMLRRRGWTLSLEIYMAVTNL